MLRKNNHLFILMLAVIILSACDNKKIYHSFSSIPLDGWGKSDTLTFTVPVNDTVMPIHISIETRNSEYYPYTNLFLFVNISRKGSDFSTTDTIEYTLANKKGRWTGTGIGAIYQNSFSYKEIPPLLHSDTLIFRINHGMTDALLQGINDIGIRLER